MLDPHREDQAAGLRRLFAPRIVRVLPLVGGGEQPGFVVGLAAALARMGQRTLVLDAQWGQVSSLIGLRTRWDLAHLLAGDVRFSDVALASREGFWLMPAARGLESLVREGGQAAELFGGFGRTAEPFDTVLVSATWQTLATLLARDRGEVVVVSTTDPVGVAQTYAQLKSMHQTGGLDRFRVIFADAASSAQALSAHQRLAAVVGRFLGVRMELGGVICGTRPSAPAPVGDAANGAEVRSNADSVGFDQLAVRSLDWSLPTFGTKVPVPSLH